MWSGCRAVECFGEDPQRNVRYYSWSLTIDRWLSLFISGVAVPRSRRPDPRNLRPAPRRPARSRLQRLCPGMSLSSLRMPSVISFPGDIGNIIFLLLLIFSQLDLETISPSWEEDVKKVGLLKRNCFASVFAKYFDLQAAGMSIRNNRC